MCIRKINSIEISERVTLAAPLLLYLLVYLFHNDVRAQVLIYKHKYIYMCIFILYM